MTDNLAPTLDSCAVEPIHVPGAIQPQGALIGFDRLGRISHLSANTNTLLGLDLNIGDLLRPESFGRSDPSNTVYRAIADAIRAPRVGRSLEANIENVRCDVVMHKSGELIVVEIEPRTGESGSSEFAQLAFQSLQELKASDSINELLSLAVTAVRRITGFDRVMAYRFAQDDSGEVIAEDRHEGLDPFLGRRYPASDIPAQARRLYLINTLRIIVDVAYTPVPIVAAPTETTPLDLSHSVLRSVSPIHVEYLGNMGVHGSMSASIVVGGRLWGMLACHHGAAMMVPYPVRMAVDVIAQVIAATLQSLIAQRREAAAARAALLRSEIVTSIASGADVADAVQQHAEGMRTMLHADAVAVLEGGNARFAGMVDARWLQSLADSLSRQSAGVVHVVREAELPPWPEDVPAAQRFTGVLALRYDRGQQGWVVALRQERVRTIRWGGKPDKHIAHGPLGPRLTPRGSFEEWRQVVRGTSSAWSPIQLEIATQFIDAVSRVHADRLIELDRLRSQLWAIMGHDLRNPLQSISMATAGLAKGHDAKRLNSVIRNSTRRMSRLLMEVLDVSRLQLGHTLNIVPEHFDLVGLLHQLVDEAMTAHPSSPIEVVVPKHIYMTADPSRLAQLVANLLSNARHHGSGDITLLATVVDDKCILTVRNAGSPIPDPLLPTLFEPFKRASFTNSKNPTGLGLGLFIAAQVATSHGGFIKYVPGHGTVAFDVTLPLHAYVGSKV